MRYVELRRHPDNEGDSLTEKGARVAERIGETSLHPPYTLFASTGAVRADQTVKILRHAAGQDVLPIVAVPVHNGPMPIGMQIIAPPWQEALALRAAAQLERDGITRGPELWAC